MNTSTASDENKHTLLREQKQADSVEYEDIIGDVNKEYDVPEMLTIRCKRPRKKRRLGNKAI